VKPVCGLGLVAAGFTLVELIAVLVVTTIIAATAAPLLTTSRATVARAAARLVVTDVAFARERAMTTGITQWVSFTAGSDSYRVLAESLVSPGRAGATVLDTLAGGKFVKRLSGEGFSGISVVSSAFDGSTDVGFNSFGSPLAVSGQPLVSAGVVTLTNSATVTIQPRTGLVRAVP